MVELMKPDVPEFLTDGENHQPTPEPEADVPEVLRPTIEKKAPIPVIGGANVHDLIRTAGHTLAVDFLVKIVPESFLGDHLLIGYLQLAMYLDFKKIGKTYKTEDPELFKQWLSMPEFGGKGNGKKK